MTSLEPSFYSSNISSPLSNDSIEDWNGGDSVKNSVIFEETKAANITNEGFKGKFVSSNVVKLSRKQLSEAEISLRSKDKACPHAEKC